MSGLATVKKRIFAFRNRELQRCLEELGLPKKGKKAEMQQRLLMFFGLSQDIQPPPQPILDQALSIVEAIYNDLKGFGPSTSTAGGAASDMWHVEHIPAGGGCASGGQGNGGLANTRIRCICQHNYDRGEMVQCEGERCGVWQHRDCMAAAGQGAADKYYCEQCRLQRSDPFWEVVQANLLPATRLQPHQRPANLLLPPSQPPMQSLERSFVLTAQQVEVLKQQPQQVRLLAVCLLLRDPVPQRVHWPKHADLRVNNVQYRTYSRNPSAKVGTNARDEPANIGSMVFVGRNRLSLSCVDAEAYLLMVVLARKRSGAAVRALMRPRESRAAAVGRVIRLVGGSGGDDDDDLVALSTTLSLRCPLSGARIQAPARFTSVNSLQAFDLTTFLDMAERSRKWLDPHTLRAASVHELQEDTYLGAVLEALAGSSGVMEVEVAPDGRWRPRASDKPWRSILDPAFQGPQALAVAVKAEGGAMEQAAALTVDDDSSDEESEGAELRAAAAAVAGSTRKRKASEPLIISLISDEEGDVTSGPAASTTQTQLHSSAGGVGSSNASAEPSQPPGAGGSSLVIRLPNRSAQQHWSAAQMPHQLAQPAQQALRPQLPLQGMQMHQLQAPQVYQQQTQVLQAMTQPGSCLMPHQSGSMAQPYSGRVLQNGGSLVGGPQPQPPLVGSPSRHPQQGSSQAPALQGGPVYQAVAGIPQALPAACMPHQATNSLNLQMAPQQQWMAAYRPATSNYQQLSGSGYTQMWAPAGIGPGSLHQDPAYMSGRMAQPLGAPQASAADLAGNGLQLDAGTHMHMLNESLETSNFGDIADFLSLDNI